MSKLPPLRWLVPITILVLIAGYRIANLLASDEDQLERRVTWLLDGVEAREARRVRRGFMSFYEDEDRGYTKEDIKQAVQVLMDPNARYRAALDPMDGIVFVSPPAVDGEYKRATLDLHFRVDVRFSRGDEYAPYWDFRGQADFEHRDGRWWIVKTRDINWAEMP